MRGRVVDVIVVGAGPSGSTAARQCALRGLDTLLVEKERFPRYKPCAGGVTRWALSGLDFELPQELVELEWHGGRVFFQDHFAEAYKPSPVGILVSRSSFDDLLLERAKQAGASVLLATKATGFDVRPGHVEVATSGGSFRGKYLVIAEGAMGKLARRVRGPYRRNEVAVTAVTEIRSSHDEIQKLTQGKIHIHFGVSRRGYGWIFPHRGYLSVGIGGIHGRATNPIHLLKHFLTEQGLERAERIRGHLVPLGGFRRRVTGDRVLLVGDAAGFVDAFAGEGIGYAILSGKLAAETIHDTLNGTPGSTPDLAAFRDRCEARFGARLRQAYYLSRTVHSLPGVFLKTLATQRETINRLLDVAMWEISYGEFLIWLLARMPRYLL
ncbi:MAG: geranylgeranyl reductase family protein [Deltaproteobacteria bacterium]|nr:geranylgeranyl reductase family protein [Deltaproteobacteria bacterium]